MTVYFTRKEKKGELTDRHNDRAQNISQITNQELPPKKLYYNYSIPKICVLISCNIETDFSGSLCEPNKYDLSDLALAQSLRLVFTNHDPHITPLHVKFLHSLYGALTSFLCIQYGMRYREPRFNFKYRDTIRVFPK